MTEALPASPVYVDANIVIYYVERDDDLQRRIRARLAACADQGVRMVMSEVGQAECMYGAWRLESPVLEDAYRRFFDEVRLIDLIPITSAGLLDAARLGAQKQLKLIDAVHFHAAVETGCGTYLTNDRRIRGSHGVEVVAP
jgi:predicted nucleic acid-binding protein